MPLSEQEQRLLEEMERSLYHNDADFVAGGSGRSGRPAYSTIVTGVLIGVVGVGTLIAGVVLRVPIVGVLGFVLMFVGVLIALTPPRTPVDSRPTSARDSDTASSASGQGGSSLPNIDDRWEGRPDDQGE